LFNSPCSCFALVLEQQYLLADLADALEAKGLVQGQAGMLR
jgi:hypothetical protein